MFLLQLKNKRYQYANISALMLTICVVKGFYLWPLSAYALNEDFNQPSIVRIDSVRLGGNNLGVFKPYEPNRGDLIARGYDYFYSKDENLGIGVWESKPGEMVYDNLAYDEMMLVIDGQLVMTGQGGKPQVFNAGEGLVLPRGWSGTLTVPEGVVRKIWVSYMGGVKGR